MFSISNRKHILSIIVVVLCSSNAFAEMYSLPVSRVMQRNSTCWAATATVILGYYNKYPDDRDEYSGDTRFMGLCEAVTRHHVLAYSQCSDSLPCPGYDDQKVCRATGLTTDSYYPCRSCCEYWYFSNTAIHCNRTAGIGKLLSDGGIRYNSTASMTISSIRNEIIVNRRPIPVYGNAHYIVIVGVDDTVDQIIVHNGWSSSSSTRGGFWVTNTTGLVSAFGPLTYYPLTSSVPTTHQIYMESERPADMDQPAYAHSCDDSYNYEAYGANQTLEVGPYILPSGLDSTFSIENDGRIVFQPGFRAESGTTLHAGVYI